MKATPVVSFWCRRGDHGKCIGFVLDAHGDHDCDCPKCDHGHLTPKGRAA